MGHQHSLGQTVLFRPGIWISPAFAGLYVVVQLLPEEDHMPRYRIRSARNGHQRVAMEAQLGDRPKSSAA